jgi:hypothetical protein
MGQLPPVYLALRREADQVQANPSRLHVGEADHLQNDLTKPDMEPPYVRY